MQLCLNCGSPVSASDDSCPRCDAQLRSRAHRLVGATLAGKYRIEERLSSGGMCDVFRARHVLIDKEVAVKVLKSHYAADAKIAGRFEQEARAASRVRHPNAIDVTDFGIAPGDAPFIVMELVEGETLGQLIRRSGPLTLQRAASILRQVGGALEAAHSVGVIHRDIKPDNILVSEYEGGDWVKVLDFGVAKIQEDVTRRGALTGANFLIGTPVYMSPEQWEGRPVDARSDIYSLGVVMYEALTGAAPFAGDSRRLMAAHTAAPPPPLRVRRPDLPPDVEAVVMRALEKDPARRPQSAIEFAQAFALAAGFGQEAAQSELPSRTVAPMNEREAPPNAAEIADETTLVRRRSAAFPVRYVRRRRRLAALALAALLACAFLAAFLLHRDRATPADPTNREVASAPVPAADAGADSTTAAAHEDSPSPAPANKEESKPQSASATSPPARKNLPESGEATDEPVKLDWGEVREQVVATLNGWANSLEARDLNAHMSYYAPMLHTFYLKRGVNRGFVHSDRARALSNFSRMKFGFRNVHVQVDPSGKSAVATYDKRWDFDGETPWSGTVRERLWLENVGGRWLITGERDLKVYAVR